MNHSPSPDLKARHLAAAVATAAPAMVALSWPTGGPEAWLLLPLSVGALLLAATGALWRSARPEGLALLTLAAAATVISSALLRPGEPESGLLNMMGAGLLLVYGYGLVTPQPIELPLPRPSRWTPRVALTLLTASVALRVAHGVPWPGLAVALSALPLLAAIAADHREGVLSTSSARLSGLAGLVAIALSLLPSLTGPQWGALAAIVPLAQTASARAGERSLLDLVVASPARLLVASFAAICMAGTVLLVLGPSATGRPMTLVDAAFTSVSATCVTGLAVLDTSAHLSLFGEVTVLLLAQVGGLGIMTFAGAASVWTGRRMSLREEATAADLLGPEARRDLAGVLGTVLKVTVITEALAALALTLAFLRHGDPLLMALWRGVFTGISAFCNAGFALQPDSLVAYQHDPLVLGTVALAITIGGLGPAVVVALPRVLRGGGSLHAKVVVATTAVLIAVPSLLYALLEWNATLSGLHPLDKLINALCQAIYFRTAGFNSTELQALQPATWTLIAMLMFIGGSPGSTAGGIKTTTLAVVVLVGVTAIRGREETIAFGRRLPYRIVLEAGAIASMGVVGVLVGLISLQLTQSMPLQLALFEVVSALGTVGLSVGGTAELDAVGKILVMTMMFAGRVGPLTLFVVLAERRADRGPTRPDGTLVVG